MSKKVYITNKYVKELEHSEIDFDLYEKILGKDWSDIDREEIDLGRDNNWWTGEGYPIEIDRVIKTLQKLKKRGANFVEIMYHCDHIGYVFNGVDIHESTEGELKKHLESEKKNKAKQEEIKALEKKLKELKS